MNGDDVALLHEELAALGYEIPDAERERKYFGDGTREAALAFQEAQGLRMTGVVEEETAASINAEVDRLDGEPDRYRVHGHVRHPNGQPAAGLLAVAIDKDLRREAEIGRTRTSEGGEYEITYTPEELSRPGKTRADLIVRTGQEGEPLGFVQLASSSLICSAPPDLEVDLVIGNATLRGPSELDQLRELIAPYLDQEELADFTREDVDFLECSVKVDRLQLATLVVASRLTRATDLPDWFFYALGRQGLRLQLEALMVVSRRKLQESVERAIEANTVASFDEDESLDSLLDRLHDVLLREAFAERSDEGSGFSVGALLSTSLVDRDGQEVFLSRYLRREGSIAEFWKSLEEDDGLSTESREDLRFTLLLGKLARYSIPVLRSLRGVRESGEISAIRDLTALDRDRWRELLREAADSAEFELPDDLPEGTPEERLEHFITTLREPIETLFPSDSLRHALHKAPDTEADLLRLLDASGDLDLYESNIDAYLAEHADRVFAGIAEDKQELLVGRIKTMQRLLRTSRRPDDVRILEHAGFDSAAAIAMVSKRRFRRRFGATAVELSDSLDGAYMIHAPIDPSSGPLDAPSELMMVLSGQPPESVADAIHDTAESKAGLHMKQYIDLATSMQLWPQATGGPPEIQEQAKLEAFKEIPELETLFGSQSFCECEHCRSVYSPAAYLVDLLAFLDNLEKDKSGSIKYPKPIDAEAPIRELLARRPDIASVKLTCENTNTPLPYIDLVNEALESFIASHLNASGEWTDVVLADTPIQALDTGDTTAEELRAVPQHVLPEVYRHLGNRAVFPMTLPFDRALESVRSCLAHLGTSRAEIMEVFGSPGAPPALAIAVERLGLVPGQYKVIIRKGPAGDAVWPYYGYEAEADLEALVRVPEFLHRTGLELDELTALLETRFVNPNLYSEDETTQDQKVIKIRFPEFPEDSCDVSKMELLNLEWLLGPNSKHHWLDRIHRFVRLWRALGWTTRDLDSAIHVVGGELDDAAVEQLAALKELAAELDRPIGELLPLWSEIDTWGGEDSYYARIFLDPTVVTESSLEWPIFAMPAPGSAISPIFETDPTKQEDLESHLATVAAALAATTDDLARVVAYHQETGAPALDKLSIESVSILYRYAALARALDLRVRDLITLRRLTAGLDPFKQGAPSEARSFVELVRQIEDSGFSIPLLAYLLVGDEEPTRHPAPTRALVERTLRAIQDGLFAIHQEIDQPSSPTKEGLRAQLERGASLLDLTLPSTGDLPAASDPHKIDRVIAALDPRVDSWQSADLTTTVPFTLAEREAAVKAHFGHFLDPVQASATLFASPFPIPDASDPSGSKNEERFLENVEFVLSRLLPWLRERLQETLVTQTLSDALDTDQALMELLLERVLTSTADPEPAMAAFRGLVAGEGVPLLFDPEDISQAPTRTFHRVFKAAALVNAFALTSEEVDYFFAASHPPEGGLELDALPLDPWNAGDSLPPKLTQLFASWRALAGYVSLRNALPRTEKTLIEYLTTKDEKVLVEATGWEAPGTPTGLAEFATMHRAVQLARRVGATAKRLTDWAQTSPDHAQAEEVVAAVKGRYERNRWLEVARSLNDLLRERQRDALVALLTHRLGPLPILEDPHPQLQQGADRPAVRELQQKLNAALIAPPLVPDGIFGPVTRQAVLAFQTSRGLVADGVVGPETWLALDHVRPNITGASDLLEYFLIDVEMSSCMLTSRIKQANASIQLFVQRCLLNLEPAVSPDEIDADRWEWMKNYRVWEANRKVFLYPENWVEPELRDDKTPFFKELETELLQSELTEESVEKALAGFLYKLDGVARLDIRALCKEEREDDRETYHVFGRTWNLPYVHFHRSGTFAGRTSEGNWTPWERIDLDIEGDHLFAAVLGRRLYLFWPLLEETADQGSSVKLAWSVYDSERWASKQVSALAPFESSVPESSHRFTAHVDGRLHIESYFAHAEPGNDWQLNLDGLFTLVLNDCNSGLVAGKQPSDTIAYRPRRSGPTRQVFVAHSTWQTGLAVKTNGLDTEILALTPAGYELVTEPYFPAGLYSFFFQDGREPNSSQTYFARPIPVALALSTESTAELPKEPWVSTHDPLEDFLNPPYGDV